MQLGMLAAVLDHLLKGRPVIGLGRKSAVNIIPQYGDPVPLCKGSTLSELTFDRLLALVFRRIPGIDNCIHVISSFLSVYSDSIPIQSGKERISITNISIILIIISCVSK